MNTKRKLRVSKTRRKEVFFCLCRARSTFLFGLNFKSLLSPKRWNRFVSFDGQIWFRWNFSSVCSSDKASNAYINQRLCDDPLKTFDFSHVSSLKWQNILDGSLIHHRETFSTLSLHFYKIIFLSFSFLCKDYLNLKISQKCLFRFFSSFKNYRPKGWRTNFYPFSLFA